jgi:hypothetical protein
MSDGTIGDPGEHKPGPRKRKAESAVEVEDVDLESA